VYIPRLLTFPTLEYWLDVAALLQSNAGMLFEYEADDKHLLDWEKVNAMEHLRKYNSAEQETVDSRVAAIAGR